MVYLWLSMVDLWLSMVDLWLSIGYLWFSYSTWPVGMIFHGDVCEYQGRTITKWISITENWDATVKTMWFVAFLHVLCKTEGRIKIVTFMGKMINHESLKLWDGCWAIPHDQRATNRRTNSELTRNSSGFTMIYWIYWSSTDRLNRTACRKPWIQTPFSGVFLCAFSQAYPGKWNVCFWHCSIKQQT